MRSLNDWISAYAMSRQHPTSKKIHTICAPIIFFAVITLLWKISILLFLVGALGSLAFYFTMGKKVAILGAVMIGACLLIQIIFGFGFFSLVALLALAWGGQFYGDKIEGRQPNLLERLTSVFIGPLWVAYPFLHKAEFFVDQ